MSCRTCKHWDVPLTKDGRRNTGRGDSTFVCRAPMPPMPKIPHSITQAYDFKRSVLDLMTGKDPRHISSSNGEGCPLHEKYVAPPVWHGGPV